MTRIVLLFSLVVLATGRVATTSAQSLELETVLSRAGEYVERYEPALGTVIAREVYTQNHRVPDFQRSSGERGAFSTSFRYQRRRLLSDFLMIRLASQGDQWMGFRAVVDVDGRPVPDRLERLQARSRARRRQWSRGGASSPRRARATTSAASSAARTCRRSR